MIELSKTALKLIRGGLAFAVLAAAWGLGLPLGAVAAEQGIVQVHTQPEGARVFVDGVRARDLTPLEIEVSPGSHELRIELDGYRTETRAVELSAGESARITLLLRPLPAHAAQDRKESFAGGYLSAGMTYTWIIASDVMLGSTVNAGEYKLGGDFSGAPGLAIQLRYIRPIRDKAFVIIDTSYLDARLHASNVKFVKPASSADKISLLLFRGSVEASIGPNYLDYLLPYLGGGFNYTVIEDTDKVGWLGGDHQETFTGYSAKAGILWDSRRHLTLTAEYQYHWAYDLEDYMIVGTVGYKF